MTSIFDPLPLAHGGNLQNRLAKAAMEEHLAGPGQLPDEHILRLYHAWGQGGADGDHDGGHEGGLGLILTGNVMVDARALTSPGVIVLDARSPLDPFREWAKVAQASGARIWMQINHPGRQVNADMPGLAGFTGESTSRA